MDKRILITGAGGFLGHNLLKQFTRAGGFEVFGAYLTGKPDAEAYGGRQAPVLFQNDLADFSGTAALLRDISPDAIIHAAAMTGVEDCERDREKAGTINCLSAGPFIEYSNKTGAALVFTSTDLVFSGDKGNYTEKDETGPLNHYARTKLACEKLISSGCRNHYILRVALLYGRGNGKKGSFLKWMEDTLKSGKKLTLFTDQYRTPLLADDAAEMILRLIKILPAKRLFHFGGAQRLSRHQFGVEFCSVFGYNTEQLEPRKMEELPGFLPRPRDCSLDISSTVRILGIRPHTCREGLGLLRFSSRQGENDDR
ncbi:MAG: hypothetical protein A2X49_09500 [Lentisphaerae bacterium GWF2_52_8]|nr:MAG: hypothetical protein A2X49_09500 [Lentisphaerae bacterium GWF2_52_8]